MVLQVVTPDGCPVEAYASLPAEPDLSAVLTHISGRRTVLDLGAGAGRIADPLAKAGFEVLAVDESAEMLTHVRHARRLQSRIEDLACDERFDAVLLLSHLVNTPVHAHRRALLATAARHLASDGVVVIQRHDPAGRLRAGHTMLGEVEIGLVAVDASQWPIVRATTQYKIGERQWDQPWEAVVLDDDRMTAALEESSLAPLRIEGSWVVAAPAPRER